MLAPPSSVLALHALVHRWYNAPRVTVNWWPKHLKVHEIWHLPRIKQLLSLSLVVTIWVSRNIPYPEAVGRRGGAQGGTIIVR